MSDASGWSAYRPSKTLWIWSIVGASALTMAVGFTWGGWTTSGKARVMEEIAVRNARAELVADMCVQKFIASSDAEAKLEALKAKSSWERDDFIQDGGWTTIAGIKDTVPNAAETCAHRLVDMKNLASPNVPPVTDS
ncbi:hypothetical protein ELI03_36060 [Rhizobium leguminosarum]|uniref:Uncharacterized protein n=1 Tax=Rhizobium leguminosarum TaxID=384 RepID=A0A4Q8XP22_RHILE|nr:hypothetical protein [Rhizobium leguminosarum]TAX63643.1 hypothetical protein ELI03_36060 [Rhizobium leguminosarum]